MTVKHFAGEYDRAKRYDETHHKCYVEDAVAYDYGIEKVVVNKTRITITAYTKHDNRGMTIQQVADALECAGANQPLFVIMPFDLENYWVKRIANGCASFYLSPRHRLNY